jgi:hypothetical protein
MEAAPANATVRYTAINDYGGALTGDAQLHH